MKKAITTAPKVVSVEKSACGAQWFVKEEKSIGEPQVLKVNNGEELESALIKANDGDTIKLMKADTYFITKALTVDKKLSLVSSEDALIKYKENTGKPLVIIAEGGDLSIDGIDFDGLTDGGIAPSAISTQNSPFLTQYNFRANDCHFYNFNAGGRTVFNATPTSYADTVLFTNCKFSNISGIAINLKAEKDDIGRYSAENVIVKNCLFYDVMGSAIDLYRGGNDESTSGPKLVVDHCTFYNVENRELGSSINLTGLQEMSITNCIFSESGKSGRVIRMESPEWANCKIDYCNFYNVGRIETFYNNRLGNNTWKVNPQFESVEDVNFALKSSSKLNTKSKQGNALGYK